MGSNPVLRVVTHAEPDHPPPRPSAPARRATIREKVDRELRSALLRTVSRRPSEAWDDLARGATRPAGRLPNRLIEAAAHGAPRSVVQAEMHAAVERVIDLVYGGVADLAA